MALPVGMIEPQPDVRGNPRLHDQDQGTPLTDRDGWGADGDAEDDIAPRRRSHVGPTGEAEEDVPDSPNTSNGSPPPPQPARDAAVRRTGDPAYDKIVERSQRQVATRPATQRPPVSRPRARAFVSCVASASPHRQLVD